MVDPTDLTPPPEMSFQDWLNDAIPAIVLKYVLMARAVKVCSTIAPAFVVIARHHGYDAYVIQAPGHFLNVVLTPEGPIELDFSHLQFQTSPSRKAVREMLIKIAKDPWKAVSVQPYQGSLRDLEEPQINQDAIQYALEGYQMALQDVQGLRACNLDIIEELRELGHRDIVDNFETDRARTNPAQPLTPNVGVFVGGEKGRRAIILLDLEAMKDGQIRYDYDALDDVLLGFFYMGWEEEGIAPEDVYVQQKTVAKHGWGPLLFEIAMAVAIKDKTQGVAPDRKELSKEAQAVWKKFYQRDDIQRTPFTEGRLWNQPHLDQIYSSNLRFGRNLGTTRAMLKRIFGRLDEAETILWEYGEAWFQAEFEGGDWSQRRNPTSRIGKLKQIAGEFASAEEFDAANLRGYGAKSVSAIAGIIDAASRDRLNLSLVRQEVAKGGQWYFLHKIAVADVDPLTHGEVVPTGDEDLSKPIIVGANRAVLDGRHRVMLAKELGIEELPAYIPARLLYQIWYDSPMMRRNPRENLCPVCSKRPVGCGACAPCIDRGGYARGCAVQMCQECYKEPGDGSQSAAGFRRNPDIPNFDWLWGRENPDWAPSSCECGSYPCECDEVDKITARLDEIREDLKSLTSVDWRTQIELNQEAEGLVLQRCGLASDEDAVWHSAHCVWPTIARLSQCPASRRQNPDDSPGSSPDKPVWVSREAVQATKNNSCPDCGVAPGDKCIVTSDDAAGGGWWKLKYNRRGGGKRKVAVEGPWLGKPIGSPRIVHSLGMWRQYPHETRIEERRNPSDDTWHCDGPMAGECGIAHKTEKTALACCAKNQRATGQWRHPHRIDCSSLIWGTDYICSCGAFERHRERIARRNPDPDCPDCQGHMEDQGDHWRCINPDCLEKLSYEEVEEADDTCPERNPDMPNFDWLWGRNSAQRNPICPDRSCDATGGVDCTCPHCGACVKNIRNHRCSCSCRRNPETLDELFPSDYKHFDKEIRRCPSCHSQKLTRKRGFHERYLGVCNDCGIRWTEPEWPPEWGSKDEDADPFFKYNANLRKNPAARAYRNPAAYSLDLTDQDISTIAFVGHRYGWSDALRGLEEGHNEFEEHEAWEIRDAFDEDTEGGHSMFPMLDSDSDLYDKLFNFWQEIV